MLNLFFFLNHANPFPSLRGCVCCSSSGELINALVEIAMRNEHEPIENRIQHVILETTGLADPTPIFQLITQGANRKGTDEIVQNYYVSGIVTLVDAKHFLSQQQHSSSDFKNEWLAQILTTDTVVINKVDLLSNPHDQLKDIKEWIHQHNPSATIYTTSYSKVPIQEAIFDIKSNIHIGPDAQQMAEKQHDPSVEQTMLLASGPVDMDKVRAFIKDTTQNYQIYRVKGVFVVKDSPYKWVVQGVGSDDVFITQHGEWEQGEAQESRLTLIGRDVMKVCSPLENEFRKCIV